jgi:hypothetical protein
LGDIIGSERNSLKDAVYDLKAVNPHRRPVVDTRTPEELMGIIEAKGQEIAKALALLRNHTYAIEPTNTDHTKASV